MRAFSVDLACAGVQRMAHKSQILHRAGELKVSEILYVYGLKKKQKKKKKKNKQHYIWKVHFPATPRASPIWN